VETSGSAFPAQIAWQINEMERENVMIYLDTIVTVIDCANFKGYEDTSYTAKLQAQYTDLLLLNKWDTVDDRELDSVLDHLYELNPETAKVKYSPEGFNLDLCFSTDAQMLQRNKSRIRVEQNFYTSENSPHTNEVDCIEISASKTLEVPSLKRFELESFLSSKALDKCTYYRIKGIVWLEDKQLYLVNWAFGRFNLTMVLDANLVELQKEHLFKFSVVGIDLIGYDKKPRESVLNTYKTLNNHLVVTNQS
jgi:G3E family GTPase